MARRKNGKPKVTPDLGSLQKGAFVPMTQSGFCQYGPGAAHIFCTIPGCECLCHVTPKPDN